MPALCPGVFTLNLNLGHDIEALARLQPNPLDWLHRRICRELKLGLARKVDLYLVLEEIEPEWPGNMPINSPPRLHVHGEFGVTDNEVEDARKCLRRAGGEFVDVLARNRQTHTRAYPDTGWVGYVAKDFWKATPYMRALLGRHRSNLRLTFGGPVLSATHAVRARAEHLFKIHRRLVLSGGKSVLV
jgi:hypothetical protein